MFCVVFNEKRYTFGFFFNLTKLFSNIIPLSPSIMKRLAHNPPLSAYEHIDMPSYMMLKHLLLSIDLTAAIRTSLHYYYYPALFCAIFGSA